MSAPGLLLSDDLIFTSRIVGTARALGLEIKSARTAAELLRQAQSQAPACVLIDLQNPSLAIADLVTSIRTAGEPFLVAYGSHVDAATLKAARAAGCDLVLPRSKFVEELPAQLASWFSHEPKT